MVCVVIMVYGQLRTLVSLLLVLAFGLGFLWGAFQLIGTVSSVATGPRATATPTALVEAPVPTATPKVVKEPPVVAPRRARRATPTPGPRRTPRPSPTPPAPPKVVVALSPTDYTGATRFGMSALTASGIPRLYCQVRNSALPTTAGALTYTWKKDAPNGFLYSYTIPRSASAYTTGYFQSTALANPGAYRCDVTLFGQPVGSARFTVVQ